MQSNFEQLSNADLHTQLVKAVRHDRQALVHFLRLLGELDARKAYREAGYSSTWAFLRVLNFSESESAARLIGGRVVHRYPWVANDLISGALHLTAVATVGRRVLQTGEAQLLEKARGRTKEELQVLIAAGEENGRKSPAGRRARVVPIVVSANAAPACLDADSRPVADAPHENATKAHAKPDSDGGLPLFAVHRQPEQTAKPELGNEATMPAAQAATTVAGAEPAVGLYRMTLFLAPEAHSDLRDAQRLARHQLPGGDLNQVVALALREFVQKRESRKHGLRREEQRRVKVQGHQKTVAAPRKEADNATSETEHVVTRDADMPSEKGTETGGNAPDTRCAAAVCQDSSTVLDAKEEGAGRALAERATMSTRRRRGRYIPAAIRRGVFLRDAGQCTFRSGSGRLCGERHMLEYDHAIPFALGGPHSIDNLRLRCRAHNALAAEAIF